MVEFSKDMAILGAALLIGGKTVYELVHYAIGSKNESKRFQDHRCSEHSAVMGMINQYKQRAEKQDEIGTKVTELKTISVDTQRNVLETKAYCRELFSRMRIAETDIAVLDKKRQKDD